MPCILIVRNRPVYQWFQIRIVGYSIQGTGQALRGSNLLGGLFVITGKDVGDALFVYASMPQLTIRGFLSCFGGRTGGGATDNAPR